jgi:hypothetical protein
VIENGELEVVISHCENLHFVLIPFTFDMSFHILEFKDSKS